MMRILYATSISYPSNLANPHQIVATVTALNKAGVVCTLGLSHLEAELPFPHKVFAGPRRSLLLGWRYARFAKEERFTHIYCREDYLLFFIMLFSRLFRFYPKFFFEAHKMHESSLYIPLLKRVNGIVSITEGLRKDLITEGVPEAKITVAPDGVDLDLFIHPEGKERARARLGLPQNKRVVLYAGQLGGWKGVETLLKASQLLSEISVAVIGGEEAEVKKFEKEYPRVRFLGRRPYAELPDNQAVADVLVLPSTGRAAISRHHTSPLKLFAYMASNIPIVAADLPSLREVVGEEDVYFFEPDNPQALAETVEKVLRDYAAALEKAAHAAQKVKHYTWDARAASILAFIRGEG